MTYTPLLTAGLCRKKVGCFGEKHYGFLKLNRVLDYTEVMYYFTYVLNYVHNGGKMKTITASRARSELFSLLKNTAKGHRQVRITSKEGSVVLMSEADYENLIETLELLSIAGLKESLQEADSEIEKGETYSLDEVFD